MSPDWFVYTRGTIHPHRLWMAIKACQEYPRYVNNGIFINILFSNQGPKFWWAWNKEDIHALGKDILKKCDHPKTRDQHFKRIQKITDQAIVAAEKIKKTNLEKLSNQEIIEQYDWLYQEVAPAHALMNVDVDAFDVVFDEHFNKQIDKELPLKDRQQLHIPTYQSFIAQQEIAILQKKSSNYLEKKFWWTRLGWENILINDEKYFKQQLRSKKSQKKLKQLLTEPKKIKLERKNIIKKYKLSNKVNYWLMVMDEYALIHDLRKEMQMRTMFSFYLLMSEAAQRLKLKKDDLEWLSYDEVQALLDGKKINKKEITRRKKHIIIKISRKCLEKYSGAKAKAFHHKFFIKKQKKVKQIKGVSAAPGKIIAKVKVCAGVVEALKKVKKGDILVCGMTLPDYVPAMKKAAAIITDEGGITCHAAIVSREINTPCIVGTKIATQVLEDGDKVEVDANRGVVKIL